MSRVAWPATGDLILNSDREKIDNSIRELENIVVVRQLHTTDYEAFIKVFCGLELNQSPAYEQKGKEERNENIC